MLRYYLVITCILFSFLGYGQDKLLLPPKIELPCRILNTTSDSVKYEVNGAKYTLPTTSIIAAVFSDGRTLMFHEYERKIGKAENNWTKHTIGLGFTYFLLARSYVYSDPDGFDFVGGIGGSITYQYNFPSLRRLSIRATLGYQSAKASGDTLGTGSASLQIMPVAAGLKLYTGKKKNFYFVGDIGAALSMYYANFNSDILVKTETKNEIGFTVGLGFGYDFRITDRWHIELDHTVRYLQASDRDDSNSNFYLRILYNL